MAWDRPILTDSGGFQVVSLADVRARSTTTARPSGATSTGPTHRLTPEHAIAIQEALGADVAVAFDHPVYPSSERAVVEDATERTHRWAERSLAAHHARGPGAVRRDPGRPRAGPARAPRRGSSPAMPFDGINIGGLAGDETPIQRRDGDRPGRRAARGRPAAALPHGPRLAGGPPGRGRPGHRPVRFGAAVARRADRPGVGARAAG